MRIHALGSSAVLTVVVVCCAGGVLRTIGASRITLVDVDSQVGWNTEGVAPSEETFSAEDLAESDFVAAGFEDRNAAMRINLTDNSIADTPLADNATADAAAVDASFAEMAVSGTSAVETSAMNTANVGTTISDIAAAKTAAVRAKVDVVVHSAAVDTNLLNATAMAHMLVNASAVEAQKASKESPEAQGRLPWILELPLDLCMSMWRRQQKLSQQCLIFIAGLAIIIFLSFACCCCRPRGKEGGWKRPVSSKKTVRGQIFPGAGSGDQWSASGEEHADGVARRLAQALRGNFKKYPTGGRYYFFTISKMRYFAVVPDLQESDGEGSPVELQHWRRGQLAFWKDITEFEEGLEAKGGIRLPDIRKVGFNPTSDEVSIGHVQYGGMAEFVIKFESEAAAGAWGSDFCAFLTQLESGTGRATISPGTERKTASANPRSTRAKTEQIPGGSRKNILADGHPSPAPSRPL